MIKLTTAQLKRIVSSHFRKPTAIYNAYRSGVIPSPLKLRNGLVVHHRPEDNIADMFYEIFVRHCYTGKYFYQPRRHHIVFDIGANIGLFALYLSGRAPGIQIHCFEPSIGTSKCLSRNLKANGVTRHVRIHRLALFNQCCRKQLFDAWSTPCNSLFANGNTFLAGNSITVSCVTLAKALEKSRVPRIDFLKIDAEGAELEIIEGTDRNVWEKIHKVAIEYHAAIRPGCLAKIERILAQNGFTTSIDNDPPYGDGLGILMADRKHV